MRENGAADSLDDGRRLPSLIAPERPGIMMWSRGAGGSLWLVENGGAARIVNGELTRIVLDPPVRSNYVFGVAGTADGGIWIVCDDRIRKWKDGRWTEDRGEYPWGDETLACCLELRDGTLAVGVIRLGLYLFFADGRPPIHFDRSNGLPQNWVRFLYEDREGNLWTGADSAGLVSIRESAFSVLNAPDQWQGRTVLSVAGGHDNALWIGTDGAGLYHHSSGKWTHYGGSEGLGNTYIPAVTETPEGEVWAGNHWWGGPYRLEQGRFVRPPNVEESWSAAFALVPVPDTDSLLVGNRDGLLQLKNGQPSTWLIKSPEGSTDDVCAVARDRQGVIWCGFAQGGLARLADGQLSIFRRQDGLASDAVHCLLSDDDGSLWIGTADNGLSRFKDGHFANLGTAQGLADEVICYILDDGLGYFWLSTHHGIQRIAKGELNRCADGAIGVVTSQIYNRSDGLPVVAFTGGRQAAACRTADGRLWFASSKGVVSANPARIRPNPLAPPVVLESLVMDGKSIRFANQAIEGRLPPDHERLEFHFSGLSFAAPDKVLFRYRLDGIDNTWVQAGSKRTAFYSRLPAGSYRFHVIACNNDGLWNTESASLRFIVAPFFWQTWWFVGLSFLAGLSVVAVFVRYITRQRIHRRMQELQRQHAIERERARIAQDIHDDVGSSLARIAMLSQPAHSELAEPQRTAAVLARIYTTAREVTRALDEIVWAVDPRHDTLDSLVSYMGKFAQDFLAAAQIRCRLDLPIELPAWQITAETRHNLFLAFKEALNNVLKHAAATEVRMSLHLHSDSYVIAITDNGRGFVPEKQISTAPGRLISGHGLSNMRRRLASVGGSCEVVTQPNRGTSVSFRVSVSGEGRCHPLQATSDRRRPASQAVT